MPEQFYRSAFEGVEAPRCHRRVSPNDQRYHHSIVVTHSTHGLGQSLRWSADGRDNSRRAPDREFRPLVTGKAALILGTCFATIVDRGRLSFIETLLEYANMPGAFFKVAHHA